MLPGAPGRPRPASCAPGWSGVISDRVFQLDLGGSIPDGLASCDGGPSDRPSHSSAWRLPASAWAPAQRTPVLPVEAMISYLPRCWASCSEVYWHPRSEWNRVEYRLPLSRTGTCGPPYRSPRTTEVGAACGHPSSAAHDLPGRSSPATVARQIESLPGADVRDITHPPRSRAHWRRGPAPGPGRGAGPGPDGPGVVAPGPQPGGP